MDGDPGGEERARSDAAAAAGRHWAPTIEDWLGPATERMLDLADIRPRARVLDVASGTGGPALRAARRVGPTGSVLATDLSAAGLAACAEAAAAAGLTQLTTRVLGEADLATGLPPGAFDATICRFGLMRFADPVATLRALLAATRAGRWTVVLVPGPPGVNPVLAEPTRMLRARAGLGAPWPGRPGMFALSDAGLLERTFREAGHTMVRVERVAADLRLEDAAQAGAFLFESLPVFERLQTLLPESGPDPAWAEVSAHLSRYVGASGFTARTELLLAAGSRPRA